MLSRAAALLLCLLAASAQALPERFTAEYALSTRGIDIGRAERSLQPTEQGRWVLQSQTRPTGIASLFVQDRLDERSVWTQQSAHWLPVEYEYHRYGGRKTQRVRVHFDWDVQLARGKSSEHKDWITEIPAGTLDPLGFQLVLMQELQQGKERFSYSIIDRRGRVKVYDITIAGREKVSTGIGDFDTVKLRQIKEPSERDLVLWCAPALAYLPVRIEYREKDGSLYRSTLQSLQGLAGAGS